MGEKNHAGTFEEYLKTLDILYVEDEDIIRGIIERRLVNYFGKVYTAQNGEAGLYKFETYRPKVVITDIQMPIMNGIEMIEKIKEKQNDVKVIVTTAYSDSSYMLRSIEIGVDKYILKPVSVDLLIDSIKQIAANLFHEEMTKELQRQKLQNEIMESTQNIFERMISLLPSPVALCSRDKTVFMNHQFMELFGAEKIGDIACNKMRLDDIFGVKDDEEVDAKRFEVNIPFGGIKIFEIAKVKLILDEERSFYIYHLKDLTRVESKNVKLKNYADILYNILKLKTKCAQEDDDMRIDEKSGATNQIDLLNPQELEALKESHTYKISANEYLAGLKPEVFREIEELEELEAEICDLLEGIEDDDFRRVFGQVGKKFVAYYRTLGMLEDFEDLAISLKNLGLYLMQLPSDQSMNWLKLLGHIKNIRADLESWRAAIFVDKNAMDIHFLDSSLLGSCIQVQLGESKKTSDA